jgi:hypothetical protein
MSDFWKRLCLASALTMAVAHGAAGGGVAAVPCHQDERVRATALSELPTGVRLTFLRGIAPEAADQALLANPDRFIARSGGAWQATDVVSGPPLPARRLIEAFQRQGRWWIWYETGGIAHTYHVAIFSSQGRLGWRLGLAETAGSTAALCRQVGP